MYFRLVYDYFREHKIQFFAVTTGRLILYIIEIIFLSVLASQLVAASQNPSAKFMTSTIWFVIVFIVASTLWFVIESYNSYIIPSIQEFTRNRILDSVFQTDHTKSDAQIGTTITNLSKMPQLVFSQIIALSFYVLPFVFTFLFLSIYFFRYGVAIASTFISVIILVLILYAFWFRRIVRLSQKRYEAELHLSEKFDDILMNAEVIINGNDVAPTLDSMRAEQETYSVHLQQELMSMNTWKQSLDCVIMILNGLILWIGYRLYVQGEMSLVVFASLVTVVIFVINRLISLVNRIGDLPYSIAGADAADHLQMGRVVNKPGKRFEHLHIRIDRLSFRHDKDVDILTNVSLDMPFRTNHLIFGESGSGKTTLCRCIMGYYRLHTPTMITIGGVPVNDIDPFFIREQVTYMTQNGFLFDSTGQDNVSKDPDVIQRLRRMRVYTKVAPLMDRQVGKLGHRLSGGERQILLLLRAVFRPSGCVILDEPTSNMDAHSRSIIMEIIQDMCKTKTVLCITHDHALIPIFSNVYDLRHGQLYRRGQTT